MKRNLTCAHCAKKVKASDGFFRTWPDPIALHHDCVPLYAKAGGKVTAGKTGRAEVRW